jgi:hypothetical protein
MVAIIGGNSLGLQLSSLAALGTNGEIGTASTGSDGESADVNVSTGNLAQVKRESRALPTSHSFSPSISRLDWRQSQISA